MDIDPGPLPQFFVGMVNVPEVDMGSSDDPSGDSSLFGPNGVFPFNLLQYSPTRNDISPVVDAGPSIVRVHTANVSRPEKADQQDTVHQQQMVRTQQRVLGLQMEAQMYSRQAMEMSVTLTKMLQEDQSQPDYLLQKAERIGRFIARAMEKAQAAENVILSQVQCATSQHEAQALEKQAADAKRLYQDTMASLEQCRQQQQQIRAMVAPPALVPQRTPTVDPAAPGHLQRIRHDEQSVQLMAPPQAMAQAQLTPQAQMVAQGRFMGQAQAMAQAQPMSLVGQIAQTQQALAHIHQSVEQVRHTLAQADQTMRAQYGQAQARPQLQQNQTMWVQQGQAQVRRQYQQPLLRARQQTHAPQQAACQNKAC